MDVLMPQLGETVAEGKITKWFKAAGDAVKPGDNLFEIETDKTSMEVPSTTSGTLAEIRFQVGEVAKVGAVVAVISGSGQATSSQSASQSPLTPATAGVQGEAALGPRFRGDERTGRYATPAMHSTPMPRPATMDPFQAVRTPERNYGPARLATGAAVTPLARRLAGERGIDL
ncbi:MAG: biotin/lipoyl-containing protein, partial [Hyphomicrobiales bacterium]